MNNKIIAVIVVLLILVGGFWFFRDKGMAPTYNTIPTENTNAIVEENPTDTTVGSIKEFQVDATSFSFTPNTMTVNKGDTVKITVHNSKGTHDLRIDEFGAATKMLQTGQSDTITFVANKSGVFEYYCSVGNHRAMGMVGKLTVN